VNQKGSIRHWSWPNLLCYFRITLGRLCKTKENIGQGHSPVRNINHRTSENELTISMNKRVSLQCSVAVKLHKLLKHWKHVSLDFM
jgi:hypothetical protein